MAQEPLLESMGQSMGSVGGEKGVRRYKRWNEMARHMHRQEAEEEGKGREFDVVAKRMAREGDALITNLNNS